MSKIFKFYDDSIDIRIVQERLINMRVRYITLRVRERRDDGCGISRGKPRVLRSHNERQSPLPGHHKRVSRERLLFLCAVKNLCLAMNLVSLFFSSLLRFLS